MYVFSISKTNFKRGAVLSTASECPFGVCSFLKIITGLSKSFTKEIKGRGKSVKAAESLLGKFAGGKISCLP